MVVVFWVYVRFRDRSLLRKCEKGDRKRMESLRRIFTDHGKSQTADYLHELGYDLK